MDSTYYYQIYGNVARMAIARGLTITIDDANRPFVDYEKNDFIGRGMIVANLFSSGDIDETEMKKRMELIRKEEIASYEKGIKYFEELMKEKYIWIKASMSSKDEELSTIFCIIKNYGVSFVKDTYVKVINELKKELTDGTRLCLITYKMPTNLFLKGLEDPTKSFLRHSELQYDPTLHIYTPKHILLSDVEKKKYLSDTKISPVNMIKILRSDAIARWFGAIPSQIFKVIFNVGGNSVFSIQYQLVI